MSETPETDAAILQILIERGVVDHRNAPECLVDKCRKLERERNEAIRILRVLKSDIDHMGHWLPDPCRKMVETFLSEEGADMSDTPETDKAWKAGIKMSAEESEDFLRQHAERLERERDQARRDELDESKWAKHYFEACQNLERQFKEAREEDQLGPCKRPDLCMLDEGHIPCPVCPNKKR